MKTRLLQSLARLHITLQGLASPVETVLQVRGFQLDRSTPGSLQLGQLGWFGRFSSDCQALNPPAQCCSLLQRRQPFQNLLLFSLAAGPTITFTGFPELRFAGRL
ncbi:MAG: hypothetical protein R3202_04545, partial [Candidatus Competibacterales bacterium]|nr:hypothetical protein [Candidatus Competibacterales bacterium]